MAGQQATIHCPIDLFPQQELEIVRLTEAINQARTAAAKAPWAQALIAAVDVLLTCERYDGENLNCCLCHNISDLRRKTAALVFKAGQLNR